MHIFELKKTQNLEINLEEAWEFFSNPKNLSKITPPHLNLKAINSIPDSMHSGMIVLYKVKPILNIPMTWVTEITHVNSPHYFVDEQRFGPYLFWHHQHYFIQCKQGIKVIDHLHYALPLLILSSMINKLVVEKKLEKIFAYRAEILKEKFGEWTE